MDVAHQMPQHLHRRVDARLHRPDRDREDRRDLRVGERLDHAEPHDVAQRLDAVERRERHVARRRGRTAAEAGLTLFRLRLLRSPAARIKVAAALLPFVLGGGWWLVHSTRPAERDDDKLIHVGPPKDRNAPPLVDGSGGRGVPDRLQPPPAPPSGDPGEASSKSTMP